MPDKNISLGILGGKLRSSLSPIMFNNYFDRLKLDISYKLYPVAPEMVSFFLSKTRTSEIIGLNVTIPFKETVIPFLDDLAPEAKAIGAVNAIHNSERRLIGYNTDYIGFLRALKRYPFMRTQNAVVLGAGGAARSVIYGLSKLKVRDITFFSRSQDKINNILGHFHSVSSLKGESWITDKIKQKMENADIVVNATPVGMFPAEKGSPVKIDFSFKEKSIVFDLIYNPKTTKFLISAESNGAVVENGLWMLIYQAAESLRIWREKALNERFFLKSSKEVLNASLS